MLMPVIIKVNENKYETSPKDWKNKSETKLPLKPKMFLISVFSGKIKFGSSGEQLNKANKIRKPAPKINKPKVSVNRLTVKLTNKFAVFLIFIFVNQF